MTTEQSETASDSSRPKLKDFKSAAFQVSNFETLTEVPPVEQFKSSQWECIGAAAAVADPMFEVYDDVITQQPQGPTAAQHTETSEDDSKVGDVGELSFDEIASHYQMLRQELDQAHEDKHALEAEHARQLEALQATLSEEIRAESQRESEIKLKAAEERYAALIEDMNNQIRESVEGVERRAVEFAVQVARKLVGTIVEINPEYVLEVIKEAVKLTGGATIKAIRVSPQDLEFLKMLAPEKQFKEFDGTWSFQGDDTIRAGCIIETSSGEVEFDLDKAWERIKDSVTKVR